MNDSKAVALISWHLKVTKFLRAPHTIDQSSVTDWSANKQVVHDADCNLQTTPPKPPYETAFQPPGYMQCPSSILGNAEEPCPLSRHPTVPSTISRSFLSLRIGQQLLAEIKTYFVISALLLGNPR